MIGKTIVKFRAVVKLGIVLICLTYLCPAHLDAQSSVEEYIKVIENPQHPNRQGFDSFSIDELMDYFGVPGVSIAVVKDFEVHWAKGYGIADIETGTKVNTETLFQAASISKPVTAMAVLKAAQDGKFSMDDDINTILKSWKLPESPHSEGYKITPRMLLSHTSGMGDGFGFPGYHPSESRPTILQILNGEKPSNVGKIVLEREPLSAFKYSGGSLTIIQLALTDIIGRSFPNILTDYVLHPIGMNNSVFEQPLSVERDQNATRAHNGKGQAMDAKWHVYPEYAAAGLWTTPTDLAKFAIEVQNSLRGKANNVLSKTMIKEMLSPVGVGDYAVGFAISKKGQGWYFEHSGGNWGFSCILVAHKVKGYGLAIMTNAARGSSVYKELKERIERAYGWDSLDKPVPY
jgi:CubicO group peptidase (beta-lactamase class C family)